MPDTVKSYECLFHSLIEKSSKFEAWRVDVCSTCNTLVFTYTNESLQNINKKDLIPIILSLQNKLEEVNNNVLVEMRRLNESFCKLQAEVSVTRQVNTILSSRLDKRTVFQMGMSRYSSHFQ